MSRHLAIGDIHGCINALRSLVNFLTLRPDDTIVTLGDYVDRGPDSKAVIDFLLDFGKHHNLVALRGNHEIMMLDSRELESWRIPWLSYGGVETLRSYASSAEEPGTFDDIPDAHIDFLENKLVSYHECESHFFVHANADASVALEDQPESTLYWRRFSDPQRHCSDKIMVCGHTIQESGLPVSNDNAICIDTWAYGGGWLSCLDVGSGTVWQANEDGETRSFTLDELEADAVKTDRQNW